jgi:hypothetical protein
MDNVTGQERQNPQALLLCIHIEERVSLHVNTSPIYKSQMKCKNKLPESIKQKGTNLQ